VVSRRIADTHVSEVLEEQLIEKFRNKSFLIQTDEATDCSDIGHLIAYVRYIFCIFIKRRATAKELFKIVEDFMKEKPEVVRLCWSVHGCSSHNGGK
jgi:hypothetical protein